jgi:hypothetical protein
MEKEKGRNKITSSCMISAASHYTLPLFVVAPLQSDMQILQKKNDITKF